MSVQSAFETQSRGRTLLVVPRGSVSSLAEAALRPELNRLMEQVDRPELDNVVFDMEDVSYFGSIMLGAMHAIWTRIRKGGGKMAVCNLSDIAREIISVSKFDSLWPICTSREEAMTLVAG